MAKHIAVAFFGVVVVTGASAQMRNPPPASIYSVGGTALGGPPASIYSLPPQTSRTCCAIGINIGGRPGHHPGKHRPIHGGVVGYPVYYPVYPYYGYVEPPSESLPNAGTFDRVQPKEDSDRTAPTLFERGYESERGDSSRYGEHYLDSRESGHPAPKASAVPPPPEPSEAVVTVLVFRDGSRQEVRNYAIMAGTLYVLSPERRKVPLTDLNLEATARENDDRGVDFRVPASSE